MKNNFNAEVVFSPFQPICLGGCLITKIEKMSREKESKPMTFFEIIGMALIGLVIIQWALHIF